MKKETKSLILAILLISAGTIIILLLMETFDPRFLFPFLDLIYLYLPLILIIGSIILVGLITGIILSKSDKRTKLKKERDLQKQIYKIFLQNKGKAYTIKALINRVSSPEEKGEILEEIREFLSELVRTRKINVKAHKDELYYFKEIKNL
jgi:uncharacterized protein YneF (UPF0154 family)